jgi:hypothetical protein
LPDPGDRLAVMSRSQPPGNRRQGGGPGHPDTYRVSRDEALWLYGPESDLLGLLEGSSNEVLVSDGGMVLMARGPALGTKVKAKASGIGKMLGGKALELLKIPVGGFVTATGGAVRTLRERPEPMDFTRHDEPAWRQALGGLKRDFVAGYSQGVPGSWSQVTASPSLEAAPMLLQIASRAAWGNSAKPEPGTVWLGNSRALFSVIGTELRDRLTL